MIPRIAHLIWYGDRFPWVNVLAIRSALIQGEIEAVVLHHDCDLRQTRFWSSLTGLKGFEARRIESSAYFDSRDPTMRRLSKLHDALETATAKANVLRAAILARHGGIYLDLDTVTVRSLVPLTNAGLFCGAERIAFPANVLRSRDPVKIVRAIGLFGLRRLCLQLPEGWRAFRRIERYYASAVNNAVIGAEPEHPFILQMLERMVSMHPRKQRVRFALGTHLLQEMLETYQKRDLVVHPPSVFYPLAPEISRFWFRTCRRPALDEILLPETRIVHWYSSVRNRAVVDRIDPAFVRQHHARQRFSALALPILNAQGA